MMDSTMWVIIGWVIGILVVCVGAWRLTYYMMPDYMYPEDWRDSPFLLPLRQMDRAKQDAYGRNVGRPREDWYFVWRGDRYNLDGKMSKRRGASDG